jgi:ribonuclease J
VEGRDRLSGLRVYRGLKGSRYTWEKNLLEELADRVLDPSEVSRRPSGYILCLSYWNLTNLLDIKPEGGTYLYSSSEAYSEEEVFDFQRLRSWLEHFHMRPVGLSFRDGGWTSSQASTPRATPLPRSCSGPSRG